MKKLVIASILGIFLSLSLAPSGQAFAVIKKPAVKVIIKAPAKKVVVKKTAKKPIKKVVKKKTKKEPLLAAPLLAPDPGFVSRR